MKLIISYWELIVFWGSFLFLVYAYFLYRDYQKRKETIKKIKFQEVVTEPVGEEEKRLFKAKLKKELIFNFGIILPLVLLILMINSGFNTNDFLLYSFSMSVIFILIYIKRLEKLKRIKEIKKEKKEFEKFLQSSQGKKFKFVILVYSILIYLFSLIILLLVIFDSTFLFVVFLI